MTLYLLFVDNLIKKIMKIKIVKIFLFAILMCGLSSASFAQKGKRVVKKRGATNTSKKKTNGKQPKKTDVAISEAAPVAADSLPIPMPKASMEQDGAIERLLQRDRTPLAYEHLREDDAVYKQRVWRNIDVREKMNETFRYDADEDNGNQLFINVLLTALQKGEADAYDPIDDRFTTKMTKSDIIAKLVGVPEKKMVPDWEKDKTGNTLKEVTIMNDFAPGLVTKFQIKEEWVFDKESSRMFVRILGISPIMDRINPVTGLIEGDKKLFWIYYPKIRGALSKAEAYNGKNFGAKPTWEELFESRMFSSYIVKSTIDNPSNQFLDQISGLKDNGILRLYAGEEVKEKIFNYEQNLWSY
jgi:gliding motility associated protien GldN